MKKKRNHFFTYLRASLLIALLLLMLSYIIYFLFHQKKSVPVSEPVTVVSEPVKENVYEPEIIKVEEKLEPETELIVEEPAIIITEEPIIDTQVPIETEEKLLEETIVPVTEEIISEAIEEVEVPVVIEPTETEEVIIAPEETKEVRIPDAPFMFEPLVIDSSEPQFFPVTVPVYDDDYFKDFYVQGEDTTLDYEDGLYYLTLYVNEEMMGSLEVKFEGGNRALNTLLLKEYVKDYLTDEAITRIFDNAPEYIDKEYLESKGVGCVIDDIEFIVEITFSISDMPVRIITVSGSNRNNTQTYALSGATELEPAIFSWVTNYNLFVNQNTTLKSDFNILSTSLSTSNFLNIGPINLDFYYSLSTINKQFDFNFSSYKMFHDFVDDNIRLSWGNISTYTLSNANTPLGIAFEKNYSYGNGSPKTNQYFQTISVTEDSELVITNEEGQELLRRTLSPGTYRIKDFLLNNGVNVITITLTPLSGKGINPDGSDFGAKQWTLQMAYDSQLLAKGDSLYGGSVSIGRKQVNVDGVFSGAPKLRVSPLYYYEYYFNDFVLNYWQDVGLTDSLTFGFDAAVATSPSSENDSILDYNAVFSTTFVNANVLGTSSFKFVTGLSSTAVNQIPRVYAMLTHRFKMENKIVSSLAIQLGYQNPSYLNSFTNHRFESSVSFGGALGFLRYSISSSLNFETDYGFFKPEFVANGSILFSPFKNTSISASVSANKSLSASNVRFSGSISASVSFGSVGSVSTSTNVVDSANVNFYTRFGKNRQHYFQASANNILFKDPLNMNIGFGYSYSGSLFGINLRSQVYNDFSSLSNSLSLSTSTAFADGVFTFARGVGENYLLIKPKGALKGSEISVARSRDNSSRVLKSRFGTALYGELSSHNRNNIVVYATGEDSFADTYTFSYEINPSSRKAYVARISASQTYTATGILIGKDGNPAELFSSPIYSLVTNDEGEVEFAVDVNQYLFTDQDGRYILSGLVAGNYFFDVQIDDNKWMSVHFEILEQKEDDTNIIEFETIDLSAGTPVAFEIDYDMYDNMIENPEIKYSEFLSGYEAAVSLNEMKVYTSEDFWNTIFPPFEEEENFTFEELASDF